LLFLALLSRGCAFGGKSSSKSGGQAVTYQYVPFDQLDPQRVSDGQPVAGQNLLEGLVTPDGTGVVAATADTSCTRRAQLARTSLKEIVKYPVHRWTPWTPGRIA
jgi:ABC-type oligopeptide transport system substrate-binding subunit